MEIKRELKQTAMSEMSEIAEKSGVKGQLTLEMTEMSGSLSDTASSEMQADAIEENDTVYLKGKRRRKYSGKSILVRRGYAEKLEYHLEKCNQELLALKRECDGLRLVESIDGFVQKLMRLHATLDEYLDEQEEEKLPVRETLLDFFFEVSHLWRCMRDWTSIM